MERGTFKAIFLMLTPKFLRGFYNRLDRDAIPKEAKRDEISLYKLPSNRPDIVSLFESMTPYFDSNIQPTEELLQLKMSKAYMCCLIRARTCMLLSSTLRTRGKSTYWNSSKVIT